MDWLRINKDLPRHPKSRRLATLLGVQEAWPRLVQLFAWAVDYAPDGIIGGEDPTWQVEDAAGWTGTPGDFAAKSVAVGFLEPLDDGRYVIHQWMEHNGKAIESAKKKVEYLKTYRDKASGRTGSEPVANRFENGSNQDRTGNEPNNGDGDGDGDDSSSKTKTLVEKGAAVGEQLEAVGTPPPTPKPTPKDLQAIWNAAAKGAPGMPHWRDMPEPRRKTAEVRLAERPLTGEEGWGAVISRIARSKFCRGGGAQGWRLTPKFLLKPDTATRVLEGDFDDRSVSSSRKDGSFAAEAGRGQHVSGEIK